MALIWASLISQVPLEHQCQCCWPIFWFCVPSRRQRALPLAKDWKLFMHFGCWIVWLCGSNVYFTEPSSINSGYEWPLHIYTATQPHTHACAHKQRQTKRLYCRLSYSFVITPGSRNFSKDYIWNVLDWNQTSSQHAGSGWQAVSIINWTKKAHYCTHLKTLC